jgi:hypothetical protein
MDMASEGLETACTWVAQKAPSTYIAWLKISGTGGRYWIIDGPSLEVSSSAAGPCSRAISILFLPSSFHQLLLQQQLIEEIWISSLAAAVARSLAAASKLQCLQDLQVCKGLHTQLDLSLLQLLPLLHDAPQALLQDVLAEPSTPNDPDGAVAGRDLLLLH